MEIKENQIVKPIYKAKIGQKVYYKDNKGNFESAIVINLKEVRNNLCRYETHLEVYIGDYSNHTKILASDEWYILKENNSYENYLTQEIYDFQKEYQKVLDKYSKNNRKQISFEEKEETDKWFNNLSRMEQQRVNNICAGREINHEVYSAMVSIKYHSDY